MIIYNDKVDMNLLRDYDAKWDDVMNLVRRHGFLVTTGLNGVVLLKKNTSVLKDFFG